MEQFLDQNTKLLKWRCINSCMEFDGVDNDELDRILSSKDECLNRRVHHDWILAQIMSQTALKSDIIRKYSTWTNRSDDICYIMSASGPKNIISLEQILLLSSVLEFGLGNIFYSKTGTNPPHLLKDLLKSCPIMEIFTTAIPYIRYIIGSPVSINIRNRAWHGFLTIDKSLEPYARLLLLIILSLGRDLGLDTRVVTRPLAPINTFTFIKQNLSGISIKDLFRFESDQFLTHIRQLYETQEYGRLLPLLLIRTESYVRRKFFESNLKYDPVSVADGYYFTLDMVLDMKFCVGKDFYDDASKNNVRNEMSNAALCLFYDCLNSPKGPRIRDRMSHGEVPLQEVTKEIVDVIGILYTTLVSNNEIEYESYFHPLSEFQRKIKGFQSRIDKFLELKIPSELNLNESEPMYDCPAPHFPRSSQVLRDPDSSQISKFLRMLCQIVETCTEAVTNYHNALEIRCQEYLERKLSQPRRKTLKNMIETRWKIIGGVVSCINFLQNACQDISVMKCHATGTSKVTNKVLKIVENLKVQLSIDKNDWKGACDGVNELEQLIK